MGNFVSELRRRNIFRVAGVYAITGWLLAQMASVLEAALNMPDWFDTMIVSALLLGFPIAMILAWAFEMTPDGVKRTEAVAEGESVIVQTGRGLDYVLISGLVLVAAIVVGNRLVPHGPGFGADMVATNKGIGFEGQSIAVLPFEDFSPDKDQAYFADGIAEELLNVLARVEGLRVASRTSAFSYKGREASISEIGAALNVAHILEGSVRKAADTLRITAQLIDVQTDEHLWSETYDRPLTAENIFVIQDEISKAIVLELNGRLDLLPETSERATQSTAALEAYLKGKDAYGPRNVDGIEIGITELIRAVTLDPEFAVAHAKLARAYVLALTYGELAPTSAYPRAEIHIQHAMALAPNDWDVLSEYAWWLEATRTQFDASDGTLDDVIAAFDVAIAGNPNNAEAHRGRGWTLAKTARLDEAKASLEQARALNPRDGIISMNLSWIARRQNDLEAENALKREAVRLTPESLNMRANLAWSYRDLGDVETAHRILQSCRMENACASSLGSLQLELGIDVHDPRLLTEYAGLTKAYLAGDFDAFAQIVPTLTGPPLPVKVALYASVGRWDKSYQLIQDNPATFAPLLQGSTAIDAESLTNEIDVLETLERQGDNDSATEGAKALRATLSKIYQGVVPGEGRTPEAYINGARWRMLEDDPDGAMLWLNALADLGRSEFVSQFAAFEPLQPRADFQAFLARMDGYRARDRALVEAQLANPPEVWWSSAELEDTP